MLKKIGVWAIAAVISFFGMAEAKSSLDENGTHYGLIVNYSSHVIQFKITNMMGDKIVRGPIVLLEHTEGGNTGSFMADVYLQEGVYYIHMRQWCKHSQAWKDWIIYVFWIESEFINTLDEPFTLEIYDEPEKTCSSAWPFTLIFKKGAEKAHLGN